APVGLILTPEIPTAYVRLSPPRQGLRLRLASATDQRGRTCALSRPQGGFVGLYSFRLLPPPGAKRLDLTFAPQGRSRIVEVVAALTNAGAAPSAAVQGGTVEPK